MKQTLPLFILCFSLLTLSACGGVKSEAKYPTGADRASTGGDIYAEAPSIFGEGGLGIFGGKEDGEEGGTSGIAVNSFLWRASLDTVAFMPLASADPFGGVIITDWYSTSDNPDERFKLTIYILDRRLRADGIKVAVYKQSRDQSQRWLSTDVAGDTAVQLENAILIRARQLRLDTLGQ